ncbi:MAG: MFS transporter [Heliobacteriaceae bacterium]|jgi:FSR family fosmidomycin resistance protein-like MFS transporter|nr:MFS transporter [Heliobacteriaceae bacterium]
MKVKSEKSAFIWLCTAHFINDVYTGVLNPIMPFIAAKLSISMAFATIILTISHIFSSLIQPVFGFFADNIKKRAFIFWGLLCTCVFISSAPAVPDPYVMTLVIIAGSIGSSLFHPQALGFVPRFAETDINKSMGIFISMGALGYSTGPVFSSWITQFMGLEKMPLMAIPGCVCALCMFKFVPKISVSEPVLRHINFRKAIKDIVSSRRLNILNLIAMLKTFVTSASTILLPFLWKDLGYSPFQIGVVIFAFLFAGALGSFFSRSAEKIMGTKRVFYISMVSTLPLMVMFALCYKTLPVLSFLIFIFTGFITSMAMPVTMVMAQGVLPEYKSIISGFINGFSWGVMAVFISAVGFAAQKFGIVNVLVVVAVIPALCSGLIEKLFKTK